MIIGILRDKYRCGCEKGQNEFVMPGILSKINSIIEWDKCEWPKKKDDDGNTIDETDFLGAEPELKPGNTFVLNGQVIAIDSPDRLILILSETGVLSLDRIYEEVFKLEFDLFFNYGDTDSVIVEEIKRDKIPEDTVIYRAPYPLMKIFKEKYLYGRHEGAEVLKTTMESGNYIFPVTIYIDGWKMFYNPEELDEEVIPVAAKEVIAWFYNNFSRNLPPKVDKEEVLKKLQEFVESQEQEQQNP